MSANVAELSAEAWGICMEFYASGYRKGVERGRELADEDARKLWQAAGVMVKGLAGRSALPDTDWIQHATSEQLTAAAEQRRTDDVARFREAHAADRATYLAGGGAA